MRTATIIYLLSLAVFWTLMIVDIATPGKAPDLYRICEDISLYVVIGSSFYRMGRDHAKKKLTKTYQKAAA